MNNQQNSKGYLDEAQKAVNRINWIAEQLMLKYELSDELGNIDDLKVNAKKAAECINNAKGQNQ